MRSRSWPCNSGRKHTPTYGIASILSASQIVESYASHRWRLFGHGHRRSEKRLSVTGSRGVRWFVGCLLAKDHRKSTTTGIPYPRPDGQHMMDALQPLERVTQPDCQLKTSRHRPDLLCIASSDQSVDQNRRGRLSAMRWECGASGKRATSVCRPPELARHRRLDWYR